MQMLSLTLNWLTCTKKTTQWLRMCWWVTLHLSSNHTYHIHITICWSIPNCIWKRWDFHVGQEKCHTQLRASDCRLCCSIGKSGEWLLSPTRWFDSVTFSQLSEAAKSLFLSEAIWVDLDSWQMFPLFKLALSQAAFLYNVHILSISTIIYLLRPK